MNTESQPVTLKLHGVYSAINSFGKFYLFKVLDLQPDYASVIIYEKFFDERPEDPDLEGLPIATVHDSGWKTAPFVLSRFARWQMQFIALVPPTDEEQLIFTGWRELGGIEITPPV